MDYQFVFFFSEGELLTLPEEGESQPNTNLIAPEDINEQDESHENTRTEFIPGEFFRIPLDVELEEVEDLKTHTWVPGGEPSSRHGDEPTASEDA